MSSTSFLDIGSKDTNQTVLSLPLKLVSKHCTLASLRLFFTGNTLQTIHALLLIYFFHLRTFMSASILLQIHHVTIQQSAQH